LEQLSAAPEQAGSVLWIEMQRYPATLLLYALGLGAVEAGKLNLLAGLLNTTILRQYKRDVAAAQLLPPFCLFGEVGNGGKFLEGMEKNYVPLATGCMIFSGKP
jgi:hypothetical protein